MFIYLNPPRTFWALPDTDIILSRSNPYAELTSEILEGFSTEQLTILDSAKLSGTVTEISRDFVPQIGTTSEDMVLSTPIREMPRYYLSKMVLSGDLKMLETLLAKEETNRSRPAVLKILRNSIDRVLDSKPEMKFYNSIKEEILDLDDLDRDA